MADLTTRIRIQLLDSFTAPIKSLKTGLKSLEKSFADVEKHTRLAADLNQAAEGMGRFADTAVGILREPINEFKEFEHQLSKVGAVGDLSAESMAALKKQALDLGSATRYSATQAAEAQENLVSAGYDVAAIMALTPQSLTLATAADLGLARASDILTGSLAAFGKEAGEAGHVIDVLATGAAVSKANVEYLSEVTAKAGPIAKQLGISLETVAAAGAAFADAQIDAAVGGTALKTVLLRLSAPSTQATKAFQKLGLAGGKLKELQAELGQGNLTGVLKTIGASFDKLGLSATDRVEKLKNIFGDEAAAQASVLIDASMRTDAKGLTELRKSFEKADGAAAKMAKRMDDDTVGAITRMESSLSGLNISIGKSLAPTVNALAGGVGELAGDMTSLTNRFPEATGATFKLVGSLAALSLGLKSILLTQSAYHGGVAALGLAYKGLSGTLLGQGGLLVAAGLASYAVGKWAEETFELSDKISSLLGRSGPDKQKERGTGRVGQMADGSTIDTKTGEYITVAPSRLARARVGTVAEYNDKLKAEREDKEAAARAASDARIGMDYRTDGGVRPEFNAVTGEATPHSPQAAQSLVLIRKATEQQTDELIAVLSEGNRLTKDMSAEVAKLTTRRGPYMGVGTMPLGGL